MKREAGATLCKCGIELKLVVWLREEHGADREVGAFTFVSVFFATYANQFSTEV